MWPSISSRQIEITGRGKSGVLAGEDGRDIGLSCVGEGGEGLSFFSVMALFKHKNRCRISLQYNTQYLGYLVVLLNFSLLR